MATINKETKITIMIIVAVIAAFLGYRVMEDLPLFKSSRVIYTYFAQVNGLTTGSYVYINGVKVGSIKALSLKEDSVEVTMNFNVGTDITKGSTAHLESTGLLGDKAIYVQKGASADQVPDGGTIQGVYEGGMLESFKKTGTKLSDDASASFDKLNKILGQVQQMVDKDNKEQIDVTLKNLKQATGQLSLMMEHKRAALESSIEHASHFMANMDTVSTANKARIDSALTGLNQSMQNFKKVSEGLDETNRHLNSILSKMDEGQGSLGKLVNDPSLYNNMDSLSVSLKDLIKNINKNPGKYLKGLRLVDIF